MKKNKRTVIITVHSPPPQLLKHLDQKSKNFRSPLAYQMHRLGPKIISVKKSKQDFRYKSCSGGIKSHHIVKPIHSSIRPESTESPTAARIEYV